MQPAAAYPPLPSFPGEMECHASWLTWSVLAFDQAQYSVAGHAHGLLGFCLTPEVYLARFGDAFVPREIPGAPANQVNAVPWYTFQYNLWAEESKARSSFKKTILASLDKAATLLVADANGSTANATLLHIFTALQAAYGTPSVHECTLQRAGLLTLTRPHHSAPSYSRTRKCIHSCTGLSNLLLRPRRCMPSCRPLAPVDFSRCASQPSSASSRHLCCKHLTDCSKM